MPMLMAIVNMAMVEPIPNFLPSSTVKAEAAGIEIAVPSPPRAQSPNKYQKLYARGMRAR